MSKNKRVRPKRTTEQIRIYETNRKNKIKLLSVEDQQKIKLDQIKYDRQYYNKNRVKILARKKEYQIENKETIVAKKMEYARQNREKVNQHSAACAHRRRACEGYLSTQDIRNIKESSDGICCYCLKRAAIMELEHCTPLSRGGFHDENNCTYACRKCNRTKSNKTVLEFIFEWPKVTDSY